MQRGWGCLSRGRAVLDALRLLSYLLSKHVHTVNRLQRCLGHGNRTACSMRASNCMCFHPHSTHLTSALSLPHPHPCTLTSPPSPLHSHSLTLAPALSFHPPSPLHSLPHPHPCTLTSPPSPLHSHSLTLTLHSPSPTLTPALSLPHPHPCTLTPSPSPLHSHSPPSPLHSHSLTLTPALSLPHPHLPCMQLSLGDVLLGSPLPHAKVSNTVCPLYVVDQILNKTDLVCGQNDLWQYRKARTNIKWGWDPPRGQPDRWLVSPSDQKWSFEPATAERWLDHQSKCTSQTSHECADHCLCCVCAHVYLQVAPGVWSDRVTSGAVKPGVKSILPQLTLFEPLQLHMDTGTQRQTDRQTDRQRDRELVMTPSRHYLPHSSAPSPPPSLPPAHPVGLLHVAEEDSSHTLDCCLLQLVHTPAVVANMSVHNNNTPQHTH